MMTWNIHIEIQGREKHITQLQPDSVLLDDGQGAVIGWWHQVHGRLTCTTCPNHSLIIMT